MDILAETVLNTEYAFLLNCIKVDWKRSNKFNEYIKLQITYVFSTINICSNFSSKIIIENQNYIFNHSRPVTYS